MFDLILIGDIITLLPRDFLDGLLCEVDAEAN